MSENYKNLKQQSKRKLLELICDLYDDIIGYKMYSDGTIRLFKRTVLFGLWPIGTGKISVFNLLWYKIPAVISQTLYCSNSFSKKIRDIINEEISDISIYSDLHKVAAAIDVLYTIHFDNEVKSKVVHKVVEEQLTNTESMNSRMLNGTLTVVETVDEPISYIKEFDVPSIFYIFKGLSLTKRAQIRSGLYAAGLFLALNSLINIGMMGSFKGTVRNKPYTEIITIPYRIHYPNSP